jgi:hypothetical protein
MIIIFSLHRIEYINSMRSFLKKRVRLARISQWEHRKFLWKNLNMIIDKLNWYIWILTIIIRCIWYCLLNIYLLKHAFLITGRISSTNTNIFWYWHCMILMNKFIYHVDIVTIHRIIWYVWRWLKILARCILICYIVHD